MYRLDVKIKLLADVLFNPMTEEAEENIADGATGGRKPKDQQIADAHKKLYRNGNGLVIPKHMLKSVMICGCGMAKLKHGRSGLWKYLKATAFVEDHADLGVTEPDYIHQSVIHKKDGKAIISYRPAVKAGREAQFRVVVYDDNITEKQVRQALEAGGIYCGVGSFRPEYGRYEVLACNPVAKE